MRSLAVLLMLDFGLGCASNESSFAPGYEVESASDRSHISISYQEESGLLSGNGGATEWIKCRAGTSDAWYILLSPEGSAFSSQGSCRLPLLQGFSGESAVNLLLINRPGLGRSEGKESFGDDISVANTKSSINSILGANQRLSGIWAYGDATLLGFRLAKELQTEMLIVGDAIFDIDMTLKDSSDSLWNARLKSIEKLEGAIFAEKRSIAWDFTGLPKSVLIYHSNSNSRVPLKHAMDFKNALATAGYYSELIVVQPPLGGGDQASNVFPHERIIKNLLTKYNKQKSNKVP